jgi:hypothetical protein
MTLKSQPWFAVLFMAGLTLSCLQTAWSANEFTPKGSAGPQPGWIPSRDNNSGSDRSDQPSGPSPARQAYDAVFKQLDEAWKRQDYREALRLAKRQQAMLDGPNVRKNVSVLNALIVWSDAKTAADYRRAITMRPDAFTQDCVRYVERLEANEKRKSDELKSRKNISANINEFASSLKAVSGAKTSNASLEFGDPMVVNANNVPSGLPKAVDDAIPQTTAGARVRKGFEAIQVGDWKVALAFFQDALNKEPGNPSLERLVALSQFTLNYRMGAHVDAKVRPDSNSETLDLANTTAAQMAARTRADAAFAKYDKKYGGHADVIAREATAKKAMRGEGYTNEELQMQLQKALLEYRKKHDDKHNGSVNGGRSPTADEISIGGKG